VTPHKDIFAGLGTDGRALVESIIASMDRSDSDPTAIEAALLRAAGQCRDRLSAIQDQIDREGLTVPGQGGEKPHPLLAEERQRQVALAKLLSPVVLFDANGTRIKSGRHVAAARARWDRVAARNG